MPDGICSVDGCAVVAKCRGWCDSHYYRWHRYGDPLAGKPIQLKPRGSLAARFWVKVDRRGPNECWPWQCPLDHNGYGTFSIGTTRIKAHRVAWFLTYGKWPEQVLDHVRDRGCVLRSCCNPAHLEDVSQRTNLLRGDTITAAQVARTHCPKGHPYAGDNLGHDNRGKRVCRACHRAQAHVNRKRAS